MTNSNTLSFGPMSSKCRVTMAGMFRATGVSCNILKDYFRSLVEKRQLTRHGTGKGSWFAQS
jgi:hypothetical protein